MKTIEFKKQNIRESVIKLSHLKHKNIIKYMCTQETSQDEIDLIVEYCNGGSIKQLIDKFSAFDEKLIKLYVRQILEGLVYLHDLGIVHRNIKNTNILVDGTGVVKITDLVVSNILVGDEPDKILSYSTMNGKECPYCVAPEIILKSKELDQAVDIWSLGCVIIEMATQKPPWSGIAKTVEEVTNLIANSNVPPKFPSHLSKECKEFLFKCLKKNPKERENARNLLEHEFFKISLTKEIIVNEEKRVQRGSFFKRKIFNKPIKQENIKSNIILKNHIILRKDTKENIKLRNVETMKNDLIKDYPNHDTLDTKKSFFIHNEILAVEESQNRNNKNDEEIINILNEEENGAFFSISMSIRQDTVTSNNHLENKFNIPNNIIFNNEIEEIIDENCSVNNQPLIGNNQSNNHKSEDKQI